MTTRYRVEYALKSHRRDQLIEWIKGLLAVPFVLHSQPTAAYTSTTTPTIGSHAVLQTMATTAHRRYAEIFRDVEELINDHIAHSNHQPPHPGPSKLQHLIPTLSPLFTPLALHAAFIRQDVIRHISSRRFVAPSFNDVRLILNSAQLIALVRSGPLELVTFDGDVTLYPDGGMLERGDAVVDRLLELLGRGVNVGVVTAAGYTDGRGYEGRLKGLLKGVEELDGDGLGASRGDLVVMGGESSYLFRYEDDAEEGYLGYVDRNKWQLPAMQEWTDANIAALLDVAESALKGCIATMNLPATIVRKARAVGIVPLPNPDPTNLQNKFTREQLEETVLVTQQVLETSEAGRKVPFCAFNGGNDVFVDIGDKSWGVMGCQRFLGGVSAAKTLHVGDQFLSAGANDFKTRSACTTAWVANPAETVALLDELTELTVAHEAGVVVKDEES